MSLIKNIELSAPLKLNSIIDYQPGQVVSRTIAQTPALSITLFSMDQGEEISTHTTSGDAMVQVLDGEAVITIGDKPLKKEKQ